MTCYCEHPNRSCGRCGFQHLTFTEVLARPRVYQVLQKCREGWLRNKVVYIPLDTELDKEEAEAIWFFFARTEIRFHAHYLPPRFWRKVPMMRVEVS